MTLVVCGCASKPPDAACRDGIELLESLEKNRSIGGILNDRFVAAIADAKELEAAGDFQACKRLTSRARVRLEDPTIR